MHTHNARWLFASGTVGAISEGTQQLAWLDIWERDGLLTSRLSPLELLHSRRGPSALMFLREQRIWDMRGETLKWYSQSFRKAAVMFLFFCLCDTHSTYMVAPQCSSCESVQPTPAICGRQRITSGVTLVCPLERHTRHFNTFFLDLPTQDSASFISTWLPSFCCSFFPLFFSSYFQLSL